MEEEVTELERVAIVSVVKSIFFRLRLLYRGKLTFLSASTLLV